MATSCMLPNPMACCASCDVAQAHDTLRDVIPLTDALRDVITLSSHCHNLMSPPPTASPPPPPPPSAAAAPSTATPPSAHRYPPPPPPSSSSSSSSMGVTRRCDRSHQDVLCPSSPRRSPSPQSPRLPKQAADPTVSTVKSVVGASAPEVAVVVPKTFNNSMGGVPLLKVSSRDLRYRGEGAEHIVLRVLTSGQVLRLRKTTVGAVTSTEDLVIRAKKDEEFLRNVARPILGPLLTEESQLVRLESNTVGKLNHTLGPERQVHRRHKEINKEGIACICPDAASIFIFRRSPMLSFLPPLSLLSSAGRFSPSSSSFCNFPVSSSSSSIASCEQVLGHIQNIQQYNGKDVHMELSLSKISQETKARQNLRTNQPSSTINRLLNASPAESGCRSSFESNNTISRESPACVWEIDGFWPSYSSSLSPSRLVSREPQNICIEIKPKQGFIDTSTPDLPLCRYCVKQYIKVGKDADQPTSRYCPLDLFSGDLERMRKAMDGLLESPQNNLKVFVDGESVDNCLSFRYLRDIIIAALTYDFAKAKVKLPKDGYLSPRSPLGRTLAFQTLDQLGVFSAASLYDHLVQVIGHAKAADALLQDLKCWTGDSQFCQSNNELCTRCTQEDRQQSNTTGDMIGRYQSDIDIKRANHLTGDKNSHVMNLSSEHLTNYRQTEPMTTIKPRKPVNSKKQGATGNHRIMDDFPLSLMQENIIRKLQEYLLSTTAKDLSLMILLSGPHRSAPTPSNAVNSSPFIIELEPDVWFRCQVTGVDLVAKPPSKILKHEQDYMRLKEVLEDLKRRGKEPLCCRQ